MASSKTNEMRGPLTGIVHLSYVFVSLALSVMISYQLGVITRENFHLQNMAKDVDRMSTKTQADSDSSQVGSLAPLFWTSAEEYIEMGHTENDVRENGGVEIDQEGDDDDDEVDTYVTTRHFMFDLESVPRELIGSKSDIEQLIEEVTKECGAKLIVHGCSQQHQSISCLGILESKGHISIHAWPQKGAVLLDVMLPDSRLIDSVEKIYGIFHPNMPNYFDPRNGSENPVQASTWYVRPRANSNYNDDYEEAMGMHGDVKYKMASVKTAFQKVDVVDFQSIPNRVDWREFKEKAPEYIEANPHLFTPDRALYLDGIVQSRLYGNAAYHEALVQPSMFAHPNPKRVAIIGGGECATLREVLKHNTVEKAVMIEIDPGVIEVSKYALPSWNDCSNFEGSSRYCMDDPRAEIYNEDAFAWFIDRYLGKNDTDKEPLFDLIIMDALDPQNVVEFARALYGDNSFLGALYNALTEDGILITQVGNAPERDDPPEQMTADKNRIIYAKSLTRQGFKSIADYSEDHTGFEEPWYFYAAFKDLSTRSYWMASEATINLKIRKRAIRTIDGTSPFDYFDGAMMKKYQLPSQASVDLFCRRQPTPVGCEVSSHGFNPYILNYPEDFFNVSRSLAGEYAGRGVFTKSMIPKGSYLMLESMVYPVTIEAPSTSLIERMSNNLFADDVLTGFLYGYGYSSLGFGVANKIEVDSGIMTFVNHGCHGASNLGMFPNMTESTVHPFLVPKELTFYRSEGEDYVFNPAIARDTFSRSEVQNRWGDIELGEELLENYYEQFSGSKDWKELVELLHGFCSGGLGEVEQYILDRNVGGDNDDEEHYLDQQNCARSAVSGSSAELMHLVDVSMMP